MTDRPALGGPSHGSANPLIRKLEHAGTLSDHDRATLMQVCSRSRNVAAGQDIIHQGDPPHDVNLVLDGMACHYKLMPDGARQITGLLLPGDFCDLHIAILNRIDHSIATLSPCTLVEIPETVIRDLMREHPGIAHAFWWATLVNEATLREWLAGLGRRHAASRMAHLFCELLLRFQAVGHAEGNSFVLPLTQTDLADILGLTNVHVNRTLHDMRRAEMIQMAKRRITICDVDRLRGFCSFDPSYLHLGEHGGSDR